MIPTIQEILLMLVKGECTAKQAEGWINQHVSLAVANAASRDAFASAAMQAALADRSDNTRYWGPQHLDSYAKDFYAMADAMLRAREGGA